MQWILILIAIIELSSSGQLKSTECDSSKIEPNSSACLDERGQDAGDSAYPSGTACKLRRDNITEIVLCTSRGWSIVKSNSNLDGYHLRRQKRFIFLLLYWLGCFFFGCHKRVRDETPPSMAGVCNGDISATADKYQVNTIVSWEERSYAYDDRDENVSTTRVTGKSPGHHFWGVTKIAYIARDRSGNMATCSFFVRVKVIRCPRIPRVRDGYYICHPSDDMIYGAVCRFGCYVGHELVGGTTMVTCTQLGTWSRPIPRCQKRKCPQLLPTGGPLIYRCTNENRYRSICTYNCLEGYDITSGMSRVRVCTRHRTWRGVEPTCTDIEPPKLSTCPGTVYAYCGRNSLIANAVWKEPSAKDNHDRVISVTKKGSISPGDMLSAGTYTVIYKAEDLSGNKANPCEMKVVVKVIRCPEIYPTPFQNVTCPSGTKYGSGCSFGCDLGSTINGTNYVVCEKGATGVYGYWTWERNQPFCEVMLKCARTPNVPGHGALSCDNWFGGKFCQMFCKKGYDVSPGRNFEEMLTCGESGEWLPRTALPLPDCSRSLSARYGKYEMSASYYFEGDCTKSETILEIQEKFIHILNTSSSFESVCSLAGGKCSVENVQVRCGATRRKRSVEMIINFDMTLKYDNTSSLRITQENMVSSLEEAQKKGELDIISNVTTLRLQSIVQNKLKLICPSRTIASFHTLSCVECSPGTFYDNDTETCPQCEKGYYQDKSGKDLCIPCPQNTTTKLIGSKDIGECIVACEPGSWSSDGTPECSQCPTGTYSDNYGAALCKRCAYSLSTENEGANDESLCKEFDLWFSGNESATSLLFETVRSHTSFIVSTWLQRDTESLNSFSFTLNDMRTDSRIELNLNRNLSLFTTRNSKLEFLVEDDGWHYVILHISDGAVEVYIGNELKCSIDENFTLENNRSYRIEFQGKGKVSQFNIWSRHLNFSLSNLVGENESCSQRWTGDILSWKRFENIQSETTFKQIPSECDDLDSCKSNPCINGNCQDTLDGFECYCHYGFYGERCDGNVDDCAENVCENNSTCVDGASNYTCLCKDGFRGDLCEIAMVDGGWGRWSQWSQCSVTCGNGTQRRTRFCSDPAPDNGGLQCPGNASDLKMCSMEECTVCSNLTVTEHVLMICENDSENTNCTLACEEGYNFDHPIKPYYVCGPDTYHLWDFKTSDNPDGKLPQCVETTNGQNMSFQFTASYISLVCDTDEKTNDTRNGIPRMLKLAIQDIDCIANDTCLLQQINVTNCFTRTKREAENKTVGFQMELSCDSQIYSSKGCYDILEDALHSLIRKSQSNSFSAFIRDQQYHIQPSSARVQTLVKCPDGAVAADIYCVECSPGRYYKYDECVKCDYGTYQDESGRSSCKECPDGTTTPGRESRSIDECSVFISEDKNDTMNIVIGVLSTVICIGILSTTIVLVRKCLNQLCNIDTMTSYNVRSKHDIDEDKPMCYAMKMQDI